MTEPHVIDLVHRFQAALPKDWQRRRLNTHSAALHTVLIEAHTEGIGMEQLAAQVAGQVFSSRAPGPFTSVVAYRCRRAVLKQQEREDEA